MNRQAPAFPSSASAQTSETPIACDLGALTAVEREEHGRLLRLVGAARELTELEDGFRLVYPAEPDLASSIARWMVFERRCCPFLGFELALGGDALLVLRLRCPPEAKALVRAAICSEMDACPAC